MHTRAGIQRNCAPDRGPEAHPLACRLGRPGRLRASGRSLCAVRLWRLAAGTAQSLGLAAGWTVCWALAVQLRPVPATTGLLLILGVFGWLYVARPLRAGDRRVCAALRLRSPGPRIWWILLLLPFCQVLHLGLLAPDGVRHLASSAAGGGVHWVPLAVVAVLLIPLVEGFFLRGFVQQRLRRALGILPALVLTSVLAALPSRPGHEARVQIAGGLLYGAAVHATRSVWSGVILHAGGNAGAMAAPWLLTPPRRSAPAIQLAITSR